MYVCIYFAQITPTLYTDNTNAIKLTKNLEYHKRSKHIDVRHFFVRERCVDDGIRIEHIDVRKLTDLLTKPIESVPVETPYHEIVISSGEQ